MGFKLGDKMLIRSSSVQAAGYTLVRVPAREEYIAWEYNGDFMISPTCSKMVDKYIKDAGLPVLPDRPEIKLDNTSKVEILESDNIEV